RQGVVGAAAAALLIGTAVPAFVHVANSDGSATAEEFGQRAAAAPTVGPVGPGVTTARLRFQFRFGVRPGSGGP
ncbi:hypothetical protein PV405_34320, partial [Streptomyces sp. ME02-6979-3A]|nr:hypothetical protein [Streptomyces sp. ME02-6979-3A]